MTDSKLIKLAGELKAKKDVLTARANGSKAKKKINIKEYQARIEFLEKEIKEMGFDPKDIINAKTVEKNYQLHIKKVNEASMMATDAAKNLELAKTAKIKPTKASIARKNTDGSTTYVLQKNTKGIIEEDDIVVLPKKLNDELESIINKYSKLFSDESLDHVKHRLLERFAQGIKKTELIGDEAKSVKTITSLKGIEAELIKIKKMLTSGEDFSSKYLSGEMKPQGQVGLYWAHGNSNNNRLTYMIPNGDTFDGIVLTKEGKIITVMNDITPAQFREHFVPLKAM